MILYGWRHADPVQFSSTVYGFHQNLKNSTHVVFLVLITSCFSVFGIIIPISPWDVIISLCINCNNLRFIIYLFFFIRPGSVKASWKLNTCWKIYFSTFFCFVVLYINLILNWNKSVTQKSRFDPNRFWPSDNTNLLFFILTGAGFRGKTLVVFLYIDPNTNGLFVLRFPSFLQSFFVFGSGYGFCLLRLLTGSQWSIRSAAWFEAVVGSRRLPDPLQLSHL